MEFFKHSDSEFTQLVEGQRYECIRICTANRLLTERGTVVYAHAGPSTNGLASPVWIAKGWHDADATHSALLLNIESIKRESAEDMLRELISPPFRVTPKQWEEFVIRARAVLERK